MQFTKPMPFEEAVEKIGGKSLIGSKLNSSEWSDVPTALRERAFFSSRVESVRALQRGRDTIGDFLSGARETLPDGQTALKSGSRAAFVQQMQEFLQREGIERGDGGLTDITSQTRLSLIFNTNTQAAHDYGYWKQGMDTDVLNEFPAQRFIREADVEVERPLHQQNEGRVELKSNLDFWLAMNSPTLGGFGTPYGPWGFNSGMGVEDVDRAEAESLGLLEPGERVTPIDVGFNDTLSASARGIDPDLLEKLKAELGDQLVIEGDELKWRETKAEPASIVVVPPRASPVSDAVDVKTGGSLKTAITAALESINAVHDDGVLPKIPVIETAAKAYGFFRPVMRPEGLRASSMAVRRTGPWPALTMVHETGHFLDLEGIGAKGSYATSNHPAMKRVLGATRKTEAFKGLRDIHASAHGTRREYFEYLMSDKEVWARAYAQFIAERSGSRLLQRELSQARASEMFRQWRPADFTPVAEAIEGMFKELGWMR